MLLFSTILNIKDTMTKDDFIRLVIEWNQGSRYADNIIPGIQWNGERNIRYGGDRLWLAIEEYRNKNIIAVRYEKKDEDGAIWDTDYVMNFNLMQMSIRLDRSYTAEALEATTKEFSTPYFITLLIKRGYLKDDNRFSVQETAIVINKENVDILIDVINRKTKFNLPVVYVSKTQDDENPINVDTLAYRLKGVAHVMVEGEKQLDHIIREGCDGNNEYYGAIGIYYSLRENGYRRYLYRKGCENSLLEKVVRSVVQYSNAQMMDVLFTWQGVNNALLRDRLNSQHEERLAAEKAQKVAEEKARKLLEGLNEEEYRIRKQAFDDAKAEEDKILESFEADLQKMNDHIKRLTYENEALQYENQRFKAKLDSMDRVPVLFKGDESEFFLGEAKDLVLETLSEALEKGIEPKSRKADIVRDIISNNDYQMLCKAKANELKRILKDYKGMTPKIKQDLKKLGFEITDEGKHYKVRYHGDERYQTTYGKTPSDGRSGMNNIRETVNGAF